MKKVFSTFPDGWHYYPRTSRGYFMYWWRLIKELNRLDYPLPSLLRSSLYHFKTSDQIYRIHPHSILRNFINFKPTRMCCTHPHHLLWSLLLPSLHQDMLSGWTYLDSWALSSVFHAQCWWHCHSSGHTDTLLWFLPLFFSPFSIMWLWETWLILTFLIWAGRVI